MLIKLRALAEYGHKDDDITQHVLAHKQRELEYLHARLDERAPDGPGDQRAESLMLIMEGAVVRAPVIGGAAAARCARLLAARVLVDSPSHAENTRRDA